ncbi:gliding motility-associated C-terminal domain-containing protein [Flavobacterium ammonificans]|uniref:T9SS type B sorting domain-containing protein n=1 Tax=Flavobacterium ammonificans TaxID=1751056 RepID=UPI001E2A06E9|nr:gliding motility-associated C-terminal domain-containing protein [Flavobacterium ammonificans]
MFIIFATTFSHGQNLNYSMTWYNVSGSYAGNSFTNQPLTLTFLNVASNRVTPWSISPSNLEVVFFNGQDVKVTLGNILNNASLDNLAGNSVSVMATPNDIWIGAVAFSRYNSDRGKIGGFSPNPATNSKLITAWSSNASNATIFSDYSNNTFRINGSFLLINSTSSSTGRWVSFTGSVPQAPTSLVATPGNGQLEIAFTPGSDGGSSITNYEYTINGGSTWVALNPVDTTSPVTISGLTNGTSYTVSLRALNILGASIGSASVTSTPVTVPSAPTNLIATRGNGELSISFTPGNNGGSAITNYEYTTNGGTTWIPLNPVDSASPVTIPGLTNGLAYTVALRAVNALGFSVSSATVNSTPPTISSFTPTSGAIGSPVVITGTDFTGATTVSFNGTNATSFTVNSATQITARIPVGATTGAISVTTPGGTVTSTTNITIGGEVLLEYPFNNSLAPSIGTGSATITSPGTTTILGANSVCTDTDWNSIVRTAAIPLSSFNANAFQFDVDFSLPSLPSTTSFLLNSSNSGRDFGVKVSNLGRLSVFYRTTFLQDIDSQFTNVQLVPNTNYNLSVQFIANTIRMRLNGNLVLVVDVADGLAVPSNPSFIFGDGFAARLPMSACIDNFRFIKDPLPFPFTDQLVISPTAFSSFEACVNRPSAAQTFSVSGTNLSNNSVVIRAPNRIYEISQNGTSFSTNPITLTASAGTLNPTTIHVRVISNPTAAVLSPTLDRILNIEVGSSNPLYRKSYILQGNISAQSPTISGSNSVMAGDSSTLTATTTPANSNVWVSSNTAVASISNTGVVTGISPGSTTITYTNASGCTATQTITVVTGTTQPPVLNSPAANTTGATTLNINYSLPEIPLAGSVRLTFTPTAGGAPIVWTMTNTTSVSFSHVVGTNPLTVNPNNVVAGGTLSFTTYNLTLSYQDANGNPVAQVTNANIQTLAPPSISFVSTTHNAVVNRAISLATINSGGAATFTIVPALPTGVVLNSSTGLISGTPTAIMSSRLYTVTATNAAGSGSATFTLFIDSDLDNDGIGDTTDPDIDGDGVPNTVEIQEGTSPTNPNDKKDTDRDGVPDYVELQQGTNPTNPNDARDTDGDGVPDYVEIQQGTNTTNPGDVKDTDGDGVPDYVEVQQGTNPTNPGDVKDTDGDGIADYIEIQQGTNPNTPGDSLLDTDGDGVPDYIEILQGTNPNAPGDQLIDTDGDGVPDYVEVQQGTNPTNPGDLKDTDGDGVPDYVEAQQGTNPNLPGDVKDTDGDGIVDYIEVQQGTNPNAPGDSLLDTDGDGVPDYIEILQGTNPNAPGDQLIDTDGDGVPDYVEVQQGTNPNNPNDARDRDGDGVPDYVEIQQGTNPTNPGDVKDTDGDGIADYIEVQQGTNPNAPGDQLIDTDGDGVPDYIEILQGTNPNAPGDQLIDTDGDGVPDYVEVQQGTNPNHPNDARDRDGDGVPDYVEIQQGTNPTNPGDVKDTDGDGIADYIEVQQGTNPNAPGDQLIDTDGDGVPDYIEILQGTNPNAPGDQLIDTDGDGVPDFVEVQQGTSPNLPGDTVDTDGDGIPNYVEIQQGTNPNTPGDQVIDTDGDGVPDYVEVQQGTNPNLPGDGRDTDGDGIPDYVENLQGTNPNTPGDSLIDTDGDGVPDYVEVQQGSDPNNPNDSIDTDGDGVPDYVEVQQGTNPNAPSDARDTDGDGTPDFIEQQEGTNPNNPFDFKDDDGDGISNYEEGYNFQNPNQSIDTDGDGIADYRDSDSDGDTILDVNDAFPLDKNEWKDTDGDGRGDNADTDDDNDGILDVCDVDVNGDGIPDNGVDMDGDGIIDSCDPDRDGDGVNNTSDNCPDTPNRDQADRDRDGLGNVCDTIELNVMEGLTPNGDGINDTWVIYNIENHPGSIVRVYNTNGKQVFYSANYKNDWNGNYQGSSEMLPVGSYMFQIDLDGDGTIDSQGWMYISK